MSFIPKHLNLAEVDEVFARCLKQMESLHIAGLVNAIVAAADGPGGWNVDKAAAVFDAAEALWQAVRSEAKK